MFLVHYALDATDSDALFAPLLGVLMEDRIAPVVDPNSGENADLFLTPLASLREWSVQAVERGERIPASDVVLAPAPPRLIWAAGVTYKRSQEARMEESSQKDVYDKVYDADRPELFLKCATVPSSNDQPITIRSDSNWNVPEPELTLVINNQQEIVAYTIGNDLSSREIEGENPLYLPQAKMWNGSAAVSQVFRLNTDDFDANNLDIDLTISRASETVFQGAANTNQLHRRFEDLVDWLHRGQDFPLGAYLMTGTGIVPPDDFTLQPGDSVTISIAAIGQLTNPVAVIDVMTNTVQSS